jgi:hypothetical protein
MMVCGRAVSWALRKKSWFRRTDEEFGGADDFEVRCVIADLNLDLVLEHHM